MNSIEKQKGATLLEILMVVGIITIITIASLSFYNSTSKSQKIEQSLREISLLVTKIEKLYANEADFSGISATMLINSGVLPDNMTRGVSRISSPWSANAISVSSYPGGKYYFNLQHIPSAEICTEIASRLYDKYFINVNNSVPRNMGDITVSCRANSRPFMSIFPLGT